MIKTKQNQKTHLLKRWQLLNIDHIDIILLEISSSPERLHWRKLFFMTSINGEEIDFT